MNNETPPYSFAAKYYDKLTSKNRALSLRLLYSFLYDLWGFSSELPRCLDVGCGTGGVFKHWDCNQIDPSSSGIDPALQMIALARKNCPQFAFESVDLMEFDSAHTYDWIVCTGNPVNYISHGNRSKFFKKARALLATGGLLYFDFDTRRDIEEFWPGQTRVVENSFFRLEATYSYDAERDVGIEKQCWSESTNDGNVFSETHYLYPISPNDIVLAQRSAGFEVPIFCHPENYTVVTDIANFLVLGCLLRVKDG